METSGVVIKGNHVRDAGHGVRITTGSADIEVSDNVFEDIEQCEERF